MQASSQWPAWKCPVHQTPLEGQDALACPQNHQFEIRDEIPRFVPASNYADHFGMQWNRYRKTQLDSYTGTTITRDRMRRCIGEEWWPKLRGAQILECGCGAGRFTEVLLAEGASVTSIDLSNAVDANRDNFPVGPRHRIAQADILNLPFAPQQYDIVLCLGVIQHTPVPEDTIRALYQHVKPGGLLVIDHYTFALGWYTKTAPLFRMVLKRMEPARAMRFVEKMVDVMLPLHRQTIGFAPARSVVWRLSPVLAYYRDYPQLNEQHQREWSLLDTHDVLTDWYKHRRSRNAIRQLLEGMGLKNVWSEYGGIGVEARGQRPAA